MKLCHICHFARFSPDSTGKDKLQILYFFTKTTTQSSDFVKFCAVSTHIYTVHCLFTSYSCSQPSISYNHTSHLQLIPSSLPRAVTRTSYLLTWIHYHRYLILSIKSLHLSKSLHSAKPMLHPSWSLQSAPLPLHPSWSPQSAPFPLPCNLQSCHRSRR